MLIKGGVEKWLDIVYMQVITALYKARIMGVGKNTLHRQVKDAVVAKLRALGHTVYDDTDEVGTTQAQNLNNIVSKTNSHDVDLVVSFHLNSYDTRANGVEVLYYDQQALSAKIAAQLSKRYWLVKSWCKGTKRPLCVIEYESTCNLN